MRNTPFFFRKSIVISLILFLTLLFFSIESVAQIELAWDPNTEPDIAGYRVYYGTASRAYGTPINVGNVTTYTLNDLSPRVVYYVAVTAYNMANDESDYSNEVSGQIAEAVSPLTVLRGPTGGTVGASNTYSAGGSSSNLNHSVQYQFDWKGDGTDLSPWGSATQSKTWTVAGTYSVRARARCAVHTNIVSSWSSSLSVTINGADLIISALTGPTTVAAGQVINLSEATRNQGKVATTVSTVTRFYWSTDSIYDASDVPLGERIVVPLAAGTTSSLVRTSVTIPPTTVPGTYYIIAKADADNAVAETSETNNTYSKSLVVVGPDLTVSAVTAPTSVGPGQAIMVGDTTNNSGAVAAPASKTYFYLSSDSSLDTADIYLGSRDVPALAAGASNTGTIPVTLSGSIASGTWYIIAKADGPGTVAEASETNNTYSKSFVVVGPDLIISMLTVTTTVAPGQEINLSEATRNQGRVATTVNTVTRFYLSTDSIYDASDVPLGERVVGPLAAGATSGPASMSVMIPPTTAAGTYYIIAKADANNSVAEVSETNNTYYRSLVVVGPDLTVLAVTAAASAGPGEIITVGDTTRNSGVVAAPASKTYFYLSSDYSLDAADTYLGSRGVPALAAGASSSGTIPVTLPGSMTPGTWYIIAKADGPEAVAEASETNNTYYKRFQVVGPDLIILTLTGPTTTVKPGQMINLSEATRNQGSRATTVNTVTRFYWSINSTLDASDVPLGERAVGSLAAGATSGPVSTSVTIPSTAAPGIYYIVAKADADNAVTEASDTNNTRYLVVRVSP